jgi:3-phosphoshikimate 1-carboxyvinyltransferase
VITIDGPTASGKGTLAAAVAQALGYHLLDSGALYRATGLASQWDGVAAGRRRPGAPGRNWAEIPALRRRPHLAARARRQPRTAHRRHRRRWPRASPPCPPVREALQGLQLAFRRAPGLVADGRDMGTVIFPGATLKVFLTASAAERADRRHKQLISKGIQASIADLRADIEARDARDKNRASRP